MRHAYYIAHLDQTFGDPEYGRDLRAMFQQVAGGFFTLDNEGKKTYHYSRFDGISRYDTPAGSTCTVIVLKNFFNQKPDAFTIQEISS